MPQVIDTGWHPLAEGVPPPWASAWGQDAFGVYAAFTVAGVTQRMRWVPPGQFLMGSPGTEKESWGDEGPAHTVTIAAGFWLAEAPCTEALWETVTGSPPSPRRGAAYPVTAVSWDDAQAFLTKLNLRQPGLDLTLPSEAQWEYACRAGTTTPYSFGTTITRKQACFGVKSPVPAGSLPPNPWGLREMHGNVWEWCADEWHTNYDGAPADGSAWVSGDGSAAGRVLRGGSWYDAARALRSACRFVNAPAYRDDYIGFRWARLH